MSTQKGYSGDLTPLFNWPTRNGETWDHESKRHIYPMTKGASKETTATQRLDHIEKRVTAVLNAFDYDTGNIYRLIAEDLASPAAEKELALLPEIDYCFTQFPECISEECMSMLGEKVRRYQIQHAHNLACEGTIDIALKWQCSPGSPQPVRYLPEEELTWVNIAHRCAYKNLDWDSEHARIPEDDQSADTESIEPRKFKRVKMNVPSPFATYNGGFYACIVSELFPLLEQLSEAWTSHVEIVVAPKLMNAEEKQEMDAYHAARRRSEEAIKLENALTDARLRRWAEEDKRRPRSGPALPRPELLERELHWLEMCGDAQ